MTDNHAILYDTEVSFKAKGLYFYIDSRNRAKAPITLTVLGKASADGDASVRTGIRELIDHGYLTVEWIRGEGGRMIGINYNLHANPKGIIRKH